MKMKHIATLLIALTGASAAGTAFAGWSSIAVQDTPGTGFSSWGWTHNYAGQGEAIVEAERICQQGGGIDGEHRAANGGDPRYNRF